MLSGDKAYELFMSNDKNPLHDFVKRWKVYGNESPVYLIAVIAVYCEMLRKCHDGRYHGKIRDEY